MKKHQNNLFRKSYQEKYNFQRWFGYYRSRKFQENTPKSGFFYNLLNYIKSSKFIIFYFKSGWKSIFSFLWALILLVVLKIMFRYYSGLDYNTFIESLILCIVSLVISMIINKNFGRNCIRKIIARLLLVSTCLWLFHSGILIAIIAGYMGEYYVNTCICHFASPDGNISDNNSAKNSPSTSSNSAKPIDDSQGLSNTADTKQDKLDDLHKKLNESDKKIENSKFNLDDNYTQIYLRLEELEELQIIYEGSRDLELQRIISEQRFDSNARLADIEEQFTQRVMEEAEIMALDWDILNVKVYHVFSINQLLQESGITDPRLEYFASRIHSDYLLCVGSFQTHLDNILENKNINNEIVKLEDEIRNDSKENS